MTSIGKVHVGFWIYLKWRQALQLIVLVIVAVDPLLGRLLDLRS